MERVRVSWWENVPTADAQHSQVHGWSKTERVDYIGTILQFVSTQHGISAIVVGDDSTKLETLWLHELTVER